MRRALMIPKRRRIIAAFVQNQLPIKKGFRL
jgi:hypothetical protein